MDLNERAKKDFFQFNPNTDIEDDKINTKCQLRKKHNNNKIMIIRQKRINEYQKKDDELNNQKSIINENIEMNDTNGKTLLNNSDILINMTKLNNISKDNITLILEYLNADDIEKNKWAIYFLRKYFQNENPELNEYLILFENKIYIYFESLLKKYEENICIVNEIFFIITNLFSCEEIINKYPDDYFLYFLNDFYLSAYKKYLMFEIEDLITAVFNLLINLLMGKKEFIKALIKVDEFIHITLNTIDENTRKNPNLVVYFVEFFRIIFDAIKNGYIKDKYLFYSFLEKIFLLYKTYDKYDLVIIKNIIILLIDSLTLLCKDKSDNEYYIAIDYLFEQNDKNNNNNYNSIAFIHYFCYSLYHNTKFYFNNNETVRITLDLIENITYNCSWGQMEQLFKSNIYRFLDILNCYYQFTISGNSQNKQEQYESNYIIQLLKVCNNIIDSDTNFAIELILSEFFSNLIKYFSINLMNKTLVDKYLDTFLRLLGYNEPRIADILFKRGIIKDGIFNGILKKVNNKNSFNPDMLMKMCKIISDYLQTVFEVINKNKFLGEDLWLYNEFKEFLLSSNIISDDIKECILSLEYMKNDF